MIPRGVAKLRGGPLWPMAFILDPIAHAPHNTRRFETAAATGTGEGGGARKRDDRRREKRENGGLQGGDPFYWCSLGVRRVHSGSAAVRCAHMPIVLLTAPIFDRPTNPGSCETAETLYIGGWGSGGREDTKP